MDAADHSSNEAKTDFAYRTDSDGPNAMGAPLTTTQTEGSIILTPEMFERMYLSPQNKVSGDLRRTFGNPTPIGLGGFLIAYCPIIFGLLGWRGFTGTVIPGAATVGTYYFSGGVLAFIAMIMEFFLGNTFPATFFGVFGAYFLSYGATLTPAFNAYLAYNPSNPAMAVEAPGFLSGLGFWNTMMGIFTVYCTICATRVNALFTLAFGFLAITFFLVAASTWVVNEQKTALAHTLQVAGGSTGFVTLVAGWYLLLAMMLASVDYPFNLPVGDLSTRFPGGSDRRKRKLAKARDLEKNE